MLQNACDATEQGKPQRICEVPGVRGTEPICRLSPSRLSAAQTVKEEQRSRVVSAPERRIQRNSGSADAGSRYGSKSELPLQGLAAFPEGKESCDACLPGHPVQRRQNSFQDSFGSVTTALIQRVATHAVPALRARQVVRCRGRLATRSQPASSLASRYRRQSRGDRIGNGKSETEQAAVGGRILALFYAQRFRKFRRKSCGALPEAHFVCGDKND